MNAQPSRTHRSVTAASEPMAALADLRDQILGPLLASEDLNAYRLRSYQAPGQRASCSSLTRNRSGAWDGWGDDGRIRSPRAAGS